MIDDLTLKRAQKGEPAALDLVLRECLDQLYPVCRRVTGNDADGADAAQDALIKIAGYLTKFDGRSRFTTWVHRIGVNSALDLLRKESRQSKTADRITQQPRQENSPETTNVDSRDELSLALRRLSSDFRQVVVMRDIADLEYSVIAEALNIPVGTVRSRLARGRAQLAETIRELRGPSAASKESTE